MRACARACVCVRLFSCSYVYSFMFCAQIIIIPTIAGFSFVIRVARALISLSHHSARTSIGARIRIAWIEGCNIRKQYIYIYIYIYYRIFVLNTCTFSCVFVCACVSACACTCSCA